MGLFITFLKQYRYIIIISCLLLFIFTLLYLIFTTPPESEYTVATPQEAANSLVEVDKKTNTTNKRALSQQSEDEATIREFMNTNLDKYLNHEVKDYSLLKDFGAYRVVSVTLHNKDSGFSAQEFIIMKGNVIIAGLNNVPSIENLRSLGVPEDVIQEYEQRMIDE